MEENDGNVVLTGENDGKVLCLSKMWYLREIWYLRERMME